MSTSSVHLVASNGATAISVRLEECLMVSSSSNPGPWPRVPHHLIHHNGKRTVFQKQVQYITFRTTTPSQAAEDTLHAIYALWKTLAPQRVHCFRPFFTGFIVDEYCYTLSKRGPLTVSESLVFGSVMGRGLRGIQLYRKGTAFPAWIHTGANI